MLKYLLIFIFFSSDLFAAQDPCLFLKYCGGRGSRGGGKSMPSESTAASLNPGELANVKGIGIEAIYQANNPFLLNIVSGNGKIGALVSPTLEGSFFGNRPIEIDEVYRDRAEHKVQYRTKKLNGALGARLLDKKNVGINVGVSVKRNPEIKKLNYGMGLSSRLWFLNIGSYIYQDDVKLNLGDYYNPYSGIPYNQIYGSSIYTEKFVVKTLTLGTKISNLSLDVGLISTKYDFYPKETRILLYSISFPIKRLVLSAAKREEQSDNLYVKNRIFEYKRKKENYFFSAHHAFGKSLVLGVNYNYFLLEEFSGTFIYYF